METLDWARDHFTWLLLKSLTTTILKWSMTENQATETPRHFLSKDSSEHLDLAERIRAQRAAEKQDGSGFRGREAGERG